MSKKIDNDYSSGKLSKLEYLKEKINYHENWGGGNLDELKEELEEEIKKNNSNDKKTLDLEPEKISAKQSPSNKSSSFRIFNYTNERDIFWQERYPTSRILFKIFEVLSVIALIVSVLIIIFVLSEGLGGIIALIPLAIAVVFFFLSKEILLFQVDRNYFEYKQSEKIFKGKK